MRRELDELRKLTKPSHTVHTVCKMVCVLAGGRSGRTRGWDYSPTALLGIRVDHISMDALQQVDELQRDMGALSIEEVCVTSMPCGGIYSWVKSVCAAANQFHRKKDSDADHLRRVC